MSSQNMDTGDSNYNNSQTSGYDSMPDQFYYDFPSQEMGPPPLPSRLQQQQPPMSQAQHMKHQMDQQHHSQMEWQSQPQQPQHHPHQQYQPMRPQQQFQPPPQHHFQPPQQQSQQYQQQHRMQMQQQQQMPPPPLPQQQTPQSQPPQEPKFLQPALPQQPTFRLNPGINSSSTSQKSALRPSVTSNSNQPSSQPQFIINNQAGASNSASNLPIHADKTRINALRQQVLHPVDPVIAEKMHSIPPTKSNDSTAELLTRLKDYNSVIPDSAAKYMMGRTGTAVNDDICYRMLAISTQKFAADILSDAMTIAKSRGLGQTNRATKETKYILTSDLMKEVLAEHGIHITGTP